jgi:hypothetical protein
MQVFPELYRAYMANDEGVEFRKTQAWKHFVDGKLSNKGLELRAKGVELNDADPQQVAEAWDIRPHGELAISPESRSVKVVGVFDTVGSLGVPDVLGMSLAFHRTQYGFHNVKLTERTCIPVPICIPLLTQIRHRACVPSISIGRTTQSFPPNLMVHTQGLGR